MSFMSDIKSYFLSHFSCFLMHLNPFSSHNIQGQRPDQKEPITEPKT
jgi:hypothetical protein